MMEDFVGDTLASSLESYVSSKLSPSSDSPGESNEASGFGGGEDGELDWLGKGMNPGGHRMMSGTDIVDDDEEIQDDERVIGMTDEGEVIGGVVEGNEDVIENLVDEIDENADEIEENIPVEDIDDEEIEELEEELEGDEDFDSEEEIEAEGEEEEESDEDDEEEEEDSEEEEEEEEDTATNECSETVEEEEEDLPIETPTFTLDSDDEEISLDKMASEKQEPIKSQEETPCTSGALEEPKKKRKRKRKTKKGDDKDGPKKKKKKKVKRNRRVNIRKIMGETKLEKETLDAQQEELERKRRLMELKKTLQKNAEEKKEKDSQLKSLLQEAEDSAKKIDEEVKTEMDKVKEKEAPQKKQDKEVIELSSGDEEEVPPRIQEEENEDNDIEAEDPDNAGSHINDQFNKPDENGLVLVNVGHPSEDDDIYLSPLITESIKYHQIGGVRFLYDNLVESQSRFNTSSGFGCILAHSMGLGKTIQMIAFTDIFLRYTKARSVLCIVPINTLQNWMAEFNMWVPDQDTIEKNGYTGMEPRSYGVYLLNDNYKTTPARSKVIEAWQKTGGVLLMGYEMYRLLASKKAHIPKPKKTKKSSAEAEVIDVDEEDRNKTLLVGVHEALVNPGPDLVVCDEGHRIKNSHAGISQSLKNIKTRRRVVLTGYPLQNNLMEYWCMVDFVRPNFLGTKTEFSNMFERPIMNGQCKDSTPQDVRLMKYRAHVLHSLLEGFVQRRGHTVLQAALPPKQEFVFMVRFSDIQKKLYQRFMESITDMQLSAWANSNPLKAFAVCCKVWNHPDILYKLVHSKKSGAADDNDLDIDADGKPNTTKRKTGKINKSASDTKLLNMGQSEAGRFSPFIDKRSEMAIPYDWALDILKDHRAGLLETGGKMVLLFNLIEQSLAIGDKILVFSQSLFTLSIIEEFLSKEKVPRPDMDELWCRNKNYFRLDGSTSGTEREKLINQFNAESNDRVWLFLLSTRAGSLGVNLVGANRVVVMDASWNPCHDCQAICRVYRFGQTKATYVYRLVTDNTLEKKIYDRQIKKQGMADRVVDELQPDTQYSRRQHDNLLAYQEKEFPVLDFSTSPFEYTDPVIINTLIEQGHWLTERPFTHESLLIDRKELRLSNKEKRLAKQSYVMEKRLNVSYSRPSYAAYYPKTAGSSPNLYRSRGFMNRPVATIRPMISTPVPMKPKVVNLHGSKMVKPGVSVHQVLTTTEILLPGTNTSTEAGVVKPNKIPAGVQILVIRTPKGVYLRTPDGKIFAVRSKVSKSPGSPGTPLENLTATAGRMSTSTTTTMSSTGSLMQKIPGTSTTSSYTWQKPTQQQMSLKPTPIKLGPHVIKKSGQKISVKVPAPSMSVKVPPPLSATKPAVLVEKQTASQSMSQLVSQSTSSSSSPASSTSSPSQLLSSIYSNTERISSDLSKEMGVSHLNVINPDLGFGEEDFNIGMSPLSALQNLTGDGTSLSSMASMESRSRSCSASLSSMDEARKSTPQSNTSSPAGSTQLDSSTAAGPAQPASSGSMDSIPQMSHGSNTTMDSIPQMMSNTAMDSMSQMGSMFPPSQPNFPGMPPPQFYQYPGAMPSFGMNTMGMPFQGHSHNFQDYMNPRQGGDRSMSSFLGPPFPQEQQNFGTVHKSQGQSSDKKSAADKQSSNNPSMASSQNENESNQGQSEGQAQMQGHSQQNQGPQMGTGGKQFQNQGPMTHSQMSPMSAMSGMPMQPWMSGYPMPPYPYPNYQAMMFPGGYYPPMPMHPQYGQGAGVGHNQSGGNMPSSNQSEGESQN